MTSLLGQISEHRESVFFMLRTDRSLSPECEELVLELVCWPTKLDDHLASVEIQNEQEKGKIEEIVDQERIKWKAEARRFNKEADQYSQDDGHRKLQDLESLHNEISEKEKILYGVVGASMDLLSSSVTFFKNEL